MKYILLIFALLIAGCDVKEPIPCKSVARQFSDANPVQFWSVDCLTYNENEVCGIHPKCWCHPWECDDEIQIQFTDTEDSEYLLGVYDSDDSLITTIPFTKHDPLAVSALSSGSQTGSGDSWVIDADPEVTILAGGNSKTLRIPFTGACLNTDYSFPYSILATGAAAGEIFVRCYDSLLNIILPEKQIVFAAGSQLFEGTFEFTGGATLPAYVGFFAFNISGDKTIKVNSVSVEGGTSIYVYETAFTPSETSPDFCNQKVQLKVIQEVSPEEVVAKSDCLDIADNQSCTTVIDYSNNRNFAGLVYTGLCSVPTFKIRVPAIFFHEQFPEEDEAMELTTGIQKTSGTLKVQRLFDTDYMPYYMHKKLQLIFKHQFITIDGLSWLKEEKYDIQQGERRWPVKKAKCFLTQDYIQRAVL